MLFKTNNYGKKICVEDYDVILDYFNFVDYKNVGSDAFPICAYTYLESSYFVKDGYLFILNKNNEILHVPFNLDGEIINVELLIKVMKEYKIKKITCVPSSHEWLSDLTVKKKINKFFKSTLKKTYGNEYIYDNFLLSELNGKDFKNLRNKVHKFWNRYKDTIKFVKYDETKYKDALKAYKLWCNELGSKIVSRGEAIWDSEFFKFCLKQYETLNIDFWLVYDNDTCVGIVGYTIINNNIAYGIFRKLSSEYNYIAQYMQYFQALKLKESNVQFLNDAYDGNEDGLRNLKMGFKPILVTNMYELSIKEK